MQFELAQSESDIIGTKIAGPRLVLKAISREYEQPYFQAFNEEVTRFLPETPATAIGQTKDFIETSRNAMLKKHALVCIISNYRAEFLGGGKLVAGDTPRKPHLSLWLKQSARGHHYGQEAAWMIAQWALERIRFDALQLLIDERDLGGSALAENLGGQVNEAATTTTEDGHRLFSYEVTPKALYEKLSREYSSIEMVG